jgi:hypothetical protein
VRHGAFFLTNILLGSDRTVPAIDLEKSVVFASDIRARGWPTTTSCAPSRRRSSSSAAAMRVAR